MMQYFDIFCYLYYINLFIVLYLMEFDRGSLDSIGFCLAGNSGMRQTDCSARFVGPMCQESFHKMDDMLRDPSFAKARSSRRKHWKRVMGQCWSCFAALALPRKHGMFRCFP